MTTPDGLLLVAAVLLPFIGMMAGLVLGGPLARRVAALTILGGGGVALAIAAAGPQVYVLGGWAPPLGVALRTDALAAGMMLVVALVVAAVAVYAWRDFTMPDGVETRAPLMFWLLLLAVWGSLNLIFVSGDLFTLYVGLELLTFAGVPLVCLDGKAETLRAALRYLLFALSGSLLYLLGVVLVQGAYGTIDIALLHAQVRPGLIGGVALALMTAGLLAKTALFPLHIWLPPAHAGAPAAASAVLSALVVKGSWFLVVRLWLDAFAGLAQPDAAQLLGGLGAAAIVVGSVVALRQRRLKLLVAYSTIAQIGYLFLMFPLAFTAAGAPAPDIAMTAGFLQAAAHATAKAGMFMAAGLLYAGLGHDRIADLGGAAKAMPVTVAAFGVAGVALMGVLPGGAYLAKKLLLGVAADTGQEVWTWVLQGGAAFTAGYVVLVLGSAFRAPPAPLTLKPVSRAAELAALGLALTSLLLGLLAIGPRIPDGLVSSPFALKELGPTALVIAGGVALALGLARRPPFGRADSGWRVPGRAVGSSFERIDSLLRRWPVATLSLLGIAAAFGGLLRP
jgi:formate hydrogenlyase subunit 3/multisubunit Na+/H+ antiporter MnhD subunit